MANFPEGKQEALETLVCKHCKKMVLKRTAKEHIALCIKSKQEKARKKKEAREAAQRAKERAERGGDDDDDDDDDVRDGKGARKNGVDGDGDDATKKGKKRKAEAEAEGDSKKKKTKKEEQKKAAKPKGPVDVEKQCGVTLPNGAQCARSLTCKSHSMGAKRAVPGRSLPYDMLLAAYQKKNQARQQSKYPKLWKKRGRVAYTSFLIHRGGNRCECPGPSRRGSRSRTSGPSRLGRRTGFDYDRHLPQPLASSAIDDSNVGSYEAEVPACAHEGDALECTKRKPQRRAFQRARRECAKYCWRCWFGTQRHSISAVSVRFTCTDGPTRAQSSNEESVHRCKLK